jgi:hypothetical protein
MTMLAHSLPEFSLPHWHTITASLIGIAAAGVALLCGRLLAGRRRRLEPQVKPEREQRDPFVYGSATEKRSALRRRGNPVKVELSDAEATQEPTEAWVVDRSVGGLCLQVDKGPVPVGTILSVRVSGASRGVPWTQVEVRSCREEGKVWELGCQFLKTPAWSVLLLFG